MPRRVSRACIKSVVDGDGNRNNNVESGNGGDESGNDDDELPIGNDQSEGWNFDLMSATAYER